MSTLIPIGISACTLGEKVRFDGGHKRLVFATDDLKPYVRYYPVCPEMAIGLPSPRPAIRLIHAEQGVRLVGSSQHDIDVTDAMSTFAQNKVPELSHLCGYIVCAKSPSCGMERVKVYDAEGKNAEKSGIGMFTRTLMEKLPWLPVEEDGRLNDPVLRENFVTRIFALHDYNQHCAAGMTRGKLVAFHSRYKLLLLAHNQAEYRALGKMIADLDAMPFDQLLIEYRNKLMAALTYRASRRNHTNVLYHIQGYFTEKLTEKQRAELSGLIERYRLGTQPLLAPVTLLRHYLQEHPDEYLGQQVYFDPYPEELLLRYGS
ncbi:YbgA family protein [Plesiomonas sp.]|uniref:YbgA family protein n=1 Tax=Plesiomonas sp. TaxID=2486279 RepID=UPI003F2E9751